MQKASAPSPSSPRSMYTRPCTLTRTRHTPVHNGRRSHSRGPTRLPRNPAGRRPSWPGPQAFGQEAPQPLAAQEPAAGRFVLGMLAPQRGPGEAAASSLEPINPLGKEVLQHPPAGTLQCVGVQPQMAPSEWGVPKSLAALGCSCKANRVPDSAGLLKPRLFPSCHP